MTKKSKLKHIIIGIIIFILVIAAAYFGIRQINFAKAYGVSTLTADDLKDIDLTKANKLMIVAHPDDEVIWGGGHLMDKDYLVVCITNGKNKKRSKEFGKVVEKSGNQGIILNYPDKVNGKRDSWKKVRKKIASDLDLIISSKDWETVVTHNSNGEYGHQHHIMTHELVTDSYLSQKSGAELMYFGRYYKAVNLPKVESQLERISDERLSYKKELSELYKSQSKTIGNLWHMAPYENFTSYSAKNTDADKTN